MASCDQAVIGMNQNVPTGIDHLNRDHRPLSDAFQTSADDQVHIGVQHAAGRLRDEARDYAPDRVIGDLRGHVVAALGGPRQAALNAELAV